MSDQSLSETLSKALSFSSDLSKQARDFGLGFPIIYWIGFFFVAYFIIYFLAVYVGPAIFGYQPWGRPYYWGRNAPMKQRFNPYLRLGHGGVAALNEHEATQLTSNVAQAIHAPPQPHRPQQH